MQGILKLDQKIPPQVRGKRSLDQPRGDLNNANHIGRWALMDIVSKNFWPFKYQSLQFNDFLSTAPFSSPSPAPTITFGNNVYFLVKRTFVTFIGPHILSYQKVLEQIFKKYAFFSRNTTNVVFRLFVEDGWIHHLWASCRKLFVMVVTSVNKASMGGFLAFPCIRCCLLACGFLSRTLPRWCLLA